jgi:hypothetical protein
MAHPANGEIVLNAMGGVPAGGAAGVPVVPQVVVPNAAVAKVAFVPLLQGAAAQAAGAVQMVGGSGRIANAQTLANGLRVNRSVVAFSLARTADIETITSHYLRNPDLPDAFVAWMNRNLATGIFEGQYLRQLQATVHGEHAMTLDAAGQKYLKELFAWWYFQVQVVTRTHACQIPHAMCICVHTPQRLLYEYWLDGAVGIEAWSLGGLGWTV